MNIRAVAGAVLATAVMIWAPQPAQSQPIPTNLNVGDFTYQFADPTTGQPLTTLGIATVGATARVAVYLLQQSGTPSNLLQQLISMSTRGKLCGLRSYFFSPRYNPILKGSLLFETSAMLHDT